MNAVDLSSIGKDILKTQKMSASGVYDGNASRDNAEIMWNDDHCDDQQILPSYTN